MLHGERIEGRIKTTNGVGNKIIIVNWTTNKNKSSSQRLDKINKINARLRALMKSLKLSFELSNA